MHAHTVCTTYQSAAVDFCTSANTVSDASTPGHGAILQGTYQVPILVQWRAARRTTREITVTLMRFD